MMDINSPKSQTDACARRIGSLVVNSKGIGQYLKRAVPINTAEPMQVKINEMKENAGATDSATAR